VIGFVVRQHGVTTLEGLSPTITASQPTTGEEIQVSVEEDAPGHYAAELTFPTEGVWDWLINAFGPEQPMPSLTALPPDATCEEAELEAPDTTESETSDTAEILAEQGAALFVAKGCVVCHQHDDAALDAYATINAGPELTDYAGDPAFLCRWLRDPSALKADTYMPTLGLAGDEIEALIAFLTADMEPSAEEDGLAPGWCDALVDASADE
jgi:cytochrome c2